MVLHDAQYLEDRLTRAMVRGFLLAMAIAAMIFLSVTGIV